MRSRKGFLHRDKSFVCGLFSRSSSVLELKVNFSDTKACQNSLKNTNSQRRYHTISTLLLKRQLSSQRGNVPGGLGVMNIIADTEGEKLPQDVGNIVSGANQEIDAFVCSGFKGI